MATKMLSVVVPVAEYQDLVQTPAATPPKRPASIKGKTVICLPNWKAISPPFMEAFAKRLNTDTDVTNAIFHNPDWQFTHPERVAKIGPEIDQLLQGIDLMTSGVAD